MAPRSSLEYSSFGSRPAPSGRPLCSWCQGSTTSHAPWLPRTVVVVRRSTPGLKRQILRASLSDTEYLGILEMHWAHYCHATAGGTQNDTCLGPDVVVLPRRGRSRGTRGFPYYLARPSTSEYHHVLSTGPAMFLLPSLFTYLSMMPANGLE